MKSTLKKTALSAALVSAMGMTTSANADIIDMSWDGLFTMLSATGSPLANTSYPYYGDPTWGYGLRTQITGTMQFDTNTGAGSGTVQPFEFFDGSSPAEAVGISLQAIGDGMGGPGTLILGNMLFNWSGNDGIPVSIVLDAAGMFGAMMDPGFGVGSVISGVGALPASDGIKKGAFPIGPVPVATTTWNTTTVNCTPGGGTTGECMGVAVSGGLPLTDDGIGGSPMVAGPFEGFNANFDVTTITITGITPDTQEIPVPAAVWLLGSGLLGLVGVARRRVKA